MFTEDYLIRLIRQATAALATVLGLAKAGQFQEALHIINQTLEELVGLSPGLVKVMDDQSLLNLLTSQDGLDIERLVVTADLFKVEGDILVAQNRSPQSNESYARALALYLEATLDEQSIPKPELIAKIEALHPQWADTRLPAETLLRLRSFYTRLLELEDAGMPNSVITHTETERHLQEIEQHMLEIQ